MTTSLLQISKLRLSDFTQWPCWYKTSARWRKDLSEPDLHGSIVWYTFHAHPTSSWTTEHGRPCPEHWPAKKALKETPSAGPLSLELTMQKILWRKALTADHGWSQRNQAFPLPHIHTVDLGVLSPFCSHKFCPFPTLRPRQMHPLRAPFIKQHKLNKTQGESFLTAQSSFWLAGWVYQPTYSYSLRGNMHMVWRGLRAGGSTALQVCWMLQPDHRPYSSLKSPRDWVSKATILYFWGTSRYQQPRLFCKLTTVECPYSLTNLQRTEGGGRQLGQISHQPLALRTKSSRLMWMSGCASSQQPWPLGPMRARVSRQLLES